MPRLKTIKVKKKVIREVNGKMVDIGYHIINESDFDPAKHEKYVPEEEKATTRAPRQGQAQ
jgi:hypothetical protein